MVNGRRSLSPESLQIFNNSDRSSNTEHYHYLRLSSVLRYPTYKKTI
ncbi:MAG: hypothetical protein AB4080_18160 [Trichodesmium sp.]